MSPLSMLCLFPQFGVESVSELGKNLAGAAVIVPDSSDGSPPEDPYA